MEKSINGKIKSIIEYIISKPNEAITIEDYNILSSELKDIRFRKSQEENNGRIQQLMSLAFPNAPISHMD